MKKVVLLVVVASLCALSGCSEMNDFFARRDAAQRDAQIKSRLGQLTKDLDACSMKRKSDPAITHVAYAECVNGAFESATFDAGYPYPDIIATLSAERLRIAEQVDKGQITDVEGVARIDDKISEVVRLDLARSDADQSGPQTQYFLQLMRTGL